MPNAPGPVNGRTPDPTAGYRLPLPSYAQAMVNQLAATAPDVRTQSCPQNIKYVPNPWQNYIVDGLRKIDTRWGYNAKPNRSASDNGGQPVVAAGDEITYHWGVGSDQGSTEVYSIDILGGHCGSTPAITWRDFTGEEPVIWTGAGRFWTQAARLAAGGWAAVASQQVRLMGRGGANRSGPLCCCGVTGSDGLATRWRPALVVDASLAAEFAFQHPLVFLTARRLTLFELICVAQVGRLICAASPGSASASPDARRPAAAI